MKEPRLQHYIPRFYLSGFVDPEILTREGKEVLWVYEKQKPIRCSSPKNEARQRDFYTATQNGSRNVDVEIWFGKLENQVAPIIARLAKDGRHVTEREREWLALFIGTMQGRTPAGRWQDENKIQPAVTQILKEAAADPSKFQSFIKETYHLPESEECTLEEIRQGILAGRSEDISARHDFRLLSIIEVGKKVAQVLLEMNWQTIYSEAPSFFLTSDDPVVSHTIDEQANRLHLRMGVGAPGVNIWFPLSRTVCLRINKSCESGCGRWVSAGIRWVNKLAIMCADRWVYASERSAKLKSLVDKRGGETNVRTADWRFDRLSY
jgi:hypothetical protein